MGTESKERRKGMNEESERRIKGMNKLSPTDLQSSS